MKAYFLITETTLVERTTPPNITDEDHLYRKMNGLPLPKWNEHLELKIHLIGSGDTRKITNDQILTEIMNKLDFLCDENT